MTYANEAKIRELGVPRELLEQGGPGAVSREVAEAMAKGGLAASGVEICVSITGIAGPGGGSPGKPVGTVWLGLATRDGESSRGLQLEGDRDAIRAAAVNGALDWLEETLSERA